MTTKFIGPKKGASQRLRNIYFKRHEETRKKAQEKAKALQTPQKRSAKNFNAPDLEG